MNTTSKYQKLFGLIIKNKRQGVVVELPVAEMNNIKSSLSRMKSKYNEENKKLPVEFRSPDLKGNLTYTVLENDKPSQEGYLVYLIQLKEQKLNFFVREDIQNG